MPPAQRNWPVIAISSAGVIFILLGLMALALPPAQEGMQLWQMDNQHAVYQMDVAGGFALSLGMALTWLGGKIWNRQLLS
jgi:drug/metabolite transporter (DMT)-like permease